MDAKDFSEGPSEKAISIRAGKSYILHFLLSQKSKYSIIE